MNYQFITLLSTIIVGVFAFLNKGHKDYDKFPEMYFNELLRSM